LHTDETGPLWAVLGAPLVGVPLMVGLLALGSGTTVDAAVDDDTGLAVEQVDMPEVGSTSEAAALPGD
jgi:hypothetical protein